MNQEVTVDSIRKAFPRKLQDKVDQEFVDQLNLIMKDDLIRDAFKENIHSYSHVMLEGRFTTKQYIDAVKYCTFKLLGSNNFEAYSKAFPDRLKRLMDENTEMKVIHNYVSAFNKSKLVNKILENAMIPVYVLNADIFQKAINVQADLMHNAKSEKVRSDAANSLLTHLKQPEVQKVQIDYGIKNDSVIEDLRKTTLELAAQQKRLIEAGHASAQDIASSKIIEGEVIEDGDE